MSVDIQAPPSGIPTLDQVLGDKINHKVEDDPMVVWDKGVFANELLRQNIVLSTDKDGAADGGVVADEGLQKGTYHGTRMALTELYTRFATNGIEPIMPMKRDLTEKQNIYKWSDPSKDNYPPHLQDVPAQDNSTTIFDPTGAMQIRAISSLTSFIVPQNISHMGTPYEGPNLAACEKYNVDNPSPKTDIMDGKNIGCEADWYSDARFAQQHFSGVNPTTIHTAPTEKVKAFIDEAGKQGLEGMKKLLSEGKDLLIEDYSYFREATGVTNDQDFQNQVSELSSTFAPTGNKAFRYACAPVIIFQLHADGRLHPLAITLDYRGNLDKSITIFNRRLTPDDKGDIDEKDDWPWRYAKTCAQTADWAAHEIAVHLVDTHMIEEATIVATHRTVPEDHILYQILSPHWRTTLPLNAAARTMLVPFVIVRLAGFGPTMMPQNSRVSGLVNWSYKNFNFQDKYIPTDLKKRGFNLETETGNKYRNYPYATDMYYLWAVIREFVSSYLGTKFTCDKDVQDDPYIPDWCKEIQTQGQVPTFPTITTKDQLIDAVTMCIHIASPQHTAVNYLQDYYYSFVPAKPPALCTPLPKDLKTLQSYKEADLTAALPIGTEDAKWKDWLLAAQLPELLSYKVDSQYNLITYAKSLFAVNKDRTKAEEQNFSSPAIKQAARIFYSRLKDLETIFQKVSERQTEGTVEYKVLQPELTAVSILI